MQDFDWHVVRDFLAVAHLGSLNKAAAALAVNATTVGRRIEVLEARLGVHLFQRSQTGYALTDEGRDLVPRAERVEAAAFAFEQRAGQTTQIRGRVCLATAENLANVVLIPELPSLRARHPELSVEIATDIRSVNLHRREADLALRLTRPTQGNVTIKRVGAMPYGLYGSADYLARRPMQSANAADFGAHDFIAWSERYADLPAAQWIDSALAGRPPALATTSLQAQVAAARVGVGLAVLPRFLGGAETLLRHVPSDADAIVQDLWLAVHADLAASARVRAVAAFVEQALRTNMPAAEVGARPARRR